MNDDKILKKEKEKKTMKKLHQGLILLLVLAFSSLPMGVNVNITNEIRADPILENERLETKATTIPFDAWIIISGSREDYDKDEIIVNGCNKTYEILRKIGFDTDQIYFLGPPGAAPGPASPYQNATATRANIQWAITNWAAGRVSSSEALGIYLFDHGGIGYLCLIGDNLQDTDLNTYLNTFETSTNCHRILIVYEACHSGSFINPTSDDNRIVITATDIDHNSNVNGDWTWAAFSEAFWSSIKSCKTIGQAFEDGEANVHALGYGGGQFPLIDDDHDETGHQVDAAGNLPNGGDGNDALNSRVTSIISCLAPIKILYWPAIRFIPQWVTSISIWVKISNLSVVQKVYARFIPANWRPPIPQPDPLDGTPLAGDPNLKLCALTDFDGDGNYTGVVSGLGLGNWKVNFIAKTSNGDFAEIESTNITLNSDGNPPSDTTDPTVMITDPTGGTTVTGIINVTAEGNDDQTLDRLELFIDGVLVKNASMPAYYPYKISYTWNSTQSGSGAHTITAKAIDKAGNSATHSIDVNMQGIPSFEFSIVIIGCFFIVITTYLLNRKRARFNLF